jgi:hypothetical protein
MALLRLLEGVQAWRMLRFWAGNGTHTGRILGYCSQCGLYHGSPDARAACAAFAAAAEVSALAAWRSLKEAVALEQAPYPVSAQA